MTDPQPDENVSPRTVAGRALLEWQSHGPGGYNEASATYWLERILAIEREASSPALSFRHVKDAGDGHGAVIVEAAEPVLDVESVAAALPDDWSSYWDEVPHISGMTEATFNRRRFAADIVARLQHPDSDGDAR